MRVYGVVSSLTDEALELFCTRREAEAVVRAWDQDEPREKGTLRVEPIDLDTGSEN